MVKFENRAQAHSSTLEVQMASVDLDAASADSQTCRRASTLVPAPSPVSKVVYFSLAT